MKILLLAWVLYASGEEWSGAVAFESMEACEEHKPRAIANLQRLAGLNPGTLRQFAIECVKPEFFDTGVRG